MLEAAGLYTRRNQIDINNRVRFDF
jgi:hypothetical protein